MMRCVFLVALPSPALPLLDPFPVGGTDCKLIHVKGELLPYQGGTNQMVITHMNSILSDAERVNLRWYWYTGKDQNTPLHARDKSRNCHVKLMGTSLPPPGSSIPFSSALKLSSSLTRVPVVDGHVGIQGNGNQDTQSWFHSQEINVMLDSPLICGEWRDAIDSNQNTRWYGLVEAKDGIWRDPTGKALPGMKKQPKGPMKSLVGVKGAIQRVRGEGGF